MTFSFYPWRFHFVARAPIHFPEGKAANVLRGAFGTVFNASGDSAYAGIFEPEGNGPSGLAEAPRPFVFRTAHLDGRTIGAGERFAFDVNVFETRRAVQEHFRRVFAEVGRAGIGPGRGRADLLAVTGAMVEIALDPPAEPVHRLAVRFLTATELKADDTLAMRPEFGVLFRRARDRVSTLRALYGAGPLELAFRDIGERADRVRMTRWEARYVDVERRSSRTGQTHPIGGFVGAAEYEGDLAEFLPVLRAAEQTGVGRQTVWGKGQIEVTAK